MKDAEMILSRGISGFHRYILDEPAHICYVSENFCRMVGITEEDFFTRKENAYVEILHPADRLAYEDFLDNLKHREQSLTSEYRILKTDGEVLYVRDQAVSYRNSEGQMMCDSILTDITDLIKQNHEMKFLNETIPCGFLKYTCEKQPKITYMNQKMKEILAFPRREADNREDMTELYLDNIFLMIPIEERRRFAAYLGRVRVAGAPVAGEITLQRCDGTRAYVFGWVTKSVNEDGNEEFQSVCMDITNRHRRRREREIRRYLKAISEVYDRIFECDFGARTVKCVYSKDEDELKQIGSLPIHLEESTESCVFGHVDECDLKRVREFFRGAMWQTEKSTREKPPQILYRTQQQEGGLQWNSGVFFNIDDSTSLYCIRIIPDFAQADILREENTSLKENMQEIVTHFTDGLAAFEITESGMVIPMHLSENVCDFFGCTKEEWEQMMHMQTPVEQFIAKSKASYAEFEKLLRLGEAEFVYFDYATGGERCIKAICSQKNPNSASSRYVMLYHERDSAKEQIEENRKENEPKVLIRAFGYFDVFVENRALAFRNKKAKELFALLVDRRGGFVSSEEAISFLWEDELLSPVLLARYRKVALRLKNTLQEYGIMDVIETVDGKRRIVPERVQCDLFDYLSGKEEYRQLFKGSYLNNYSWAETTLGELVQSKETQ